MKKFLVAVGLGTVGVVFALGLTVGALAVAGPDVGEPPTVPVLDTAPEPSPTPTATVANPHKGDGKDDDRPSGKDDDRTSTKPTDSTSSTPTTDDRSGSSDGGTGDDSGSQDHESHSGSEDHEEPDDD